MKKENPKLMNMPMGREGSIGTGLEILDGFINKNEKHAVAINH